MGYLLQLKNIKRSFGAIHALRGVDFDIQAGEVIGLCGENGAGKSTLVKIISGFDNGYSGDYFFQDQGVTFPHPGKAEEAGIAIAQQELSLIPSMSVAENIFLTGHNVPVFSTKFTLAKRAKKYLDEVGLTDINPLTKVERLSVGEQHLVEVARLVAHDPKILILDEPTAALGESDSVRILDMVTRLAKQGKAIIYVSHRLDEVFKVCNRITVLRDGESQATKKVTELNVDLLVELMLGRELSNMFPTRQHKKASKKAGKKITAKSLLKVKELWPDGLLEPVNFDIYAGEILGLAGQLGCGSGEILGAIAGAHKTRSGVITMDGVDFLPERPRKAIGKKIAYCSENRKVDGLFLGRPIYENLTAPALSALSKLGLVNKKREQELTFDIGTKFTIDTLRVKAEASVLSGGNQQKVALGKWLSIAPEIILVNEPTRGVDVGARAEIYQKLRDLADGGAAVVIASTDMLEISNLPDRVLTFYRGMHIGEYALKDIKMNKILKEITDPFDEAGI